MMQVLTKDDFFTNTAPLIRKLKKSIFIYPTDTIYGIGCDATNPDLVQKIRDIKERYDMPFSIIAPSKKWIEENCILHSTAMIWLNKLPGPLTLILRLKNKSCVASNVIPKNDSIGIRLPNHWISNFVQKLDFPVITTSANKTGKSFLKNPKLLSPELEKATDYLFNEGELQGTPSKLVHLEETDVRVISRV